VYSYRLNVTATVRCYINVKVTYHLTRYFCSVATASEGLSMQYGVELNVVGNPALVDHVSQWAKPPWEIRCGITADIGVHGQP